MENKNLIFVMVPLLSGALWGAPIDVDVKGETKDRIQIQRVKPKADADIKDVIPFSRLGQTDYILNEELDYLDEEKQIVLMDVRSPKVYKPSMIDFPKPPFFVQSFPPPPEPIVIDRSPNALPPKGQVESWTFIVVDQNNRLLKKIEGTQPPVEAIKWDGTARGEFILRTDEIYSSMLIINESRGVTRQIPGDPLWLPALRYLRSNEIVFEFSNKRVYEDRGQEFAPPLRVLVDQLVNELKKFDGAPFQITIYDRDLALSQKRASTWKKYLRANLLKSEENFDVKVALPASRGEITEVLLRITQ